MPEAENARAGKPQREGGSIQVVKRETGSANRLSTGFSLFDRKKKGAGSGGQPPRLPGYNKGRSVPTASRPWQRSLSRGNAMSAPPSPSSYDELPYPGSAFAQTHPDLLGTLATL